MIFDVPYHSQDDDDFCAPAVAMMLLHGCGVPLLHLKQEWHFALGRHLTLVAGEDRLITGPTGLSNLLNEELGARTKVGWRPFDRFLCASADAALVLIQNRIAGSGWPAFTFVNGGHWVCVTGIWEPSPGEIWVRLNEPIEGTECDGVPPHDPNVPCCGPGGLVNGPVRTSYRLDEFRSRLEECRALRDLTGSAFVVVAARPGVAPSPLRVIPDERGAPANFEPAESLRIPLLVGGKQGLSPHEIVLAREGPEAQSWRTILLAESRPVGTAEGSLPHFVAREDATPLARESLRLRPERPVRVSEALEWTFCRESRTPFRPFWRVTIDPASEREIPVFVRIDGAVFPGLHTPAPGG